MKKFLIPIFTFFCIQVAHGKSVTIIIAGDVMPHQQIKQCASDHSKGKTNNDGYDYLFERIRNTIQSADCASANLEFAVYPPYNGGKTVFNAPPQIISALIKSGFTAASFSNNHIFDMGISGFRNTLNKLENNSMPYIGSAADETLARNGYVFKNNDITIGMLSYSGLSNYPDMPHNESDYYVNWLYDIRTVREDIAAMRKKADFIIMQVHTGDEYSTQPRESDRKLLKEYLEAGADIIIGHHPHVLQPAEEYRTTDGRLCTIFYSIGNFISDQHQSAVIPGTRKTISVRNSIVTRIHIFRTPAIKYTIDIIPVYVINKYIKNDNGYIKSIQPVNMIEEIKELQNKLNNHSINNETRIEYSALIKLYKDNISAIRMIIFRYGKPLLTRMAD